MFLSLLGRHAVLNEFLKALNALGSTGSERAVDPLLARLDDDDSDVRERAAHALQKIITPTAAEQFVSRIDEKHVSGQYLYFTALFEYLQKNKLYIDELPPEVIERNPFWKENLKE